MEQVPGRVSPIVKDDDMHIALWNPALFRVTGGEASHQGAPGFSIRVDEIGDPRARIDFPPPVDAVPVMRLMRENLWAFELVFDEPVPDVALTYFADVRHQLYWTDENDVVHPQEVGPEALTGFRVARWAVGKLCVKRLRCEFPLRLPGAVFLTRLELPGHGATSRLRARWREWREARRHRRVPPAPWAAEKICLDLWDDVLVSIVEGRAVYDGGGAGVAIQVDVPGPRGAQADFPTATDDVRFLRLVSEGMQSYAVVFAEPVTAVALTYCATIPHRLEWTYANEALSECEVVSADDLRGLRVARRNAGDVGIRSLRCIFENARGDAAFFTSIAVTPASGQGERPEKVGIYPPWTMSPWRV